jgi:hypothetical protein
VAGAPGSAGPDGRAGATGTAGADGAEEDQAGATGRGPLKATARARAKVRATGSKVTGSGHRLLDSSPMVLSSNRRPAPAPQLLTLRNRSPLPRLLPHRLLPWPRVPAEHNRPGRPAVA